MHTLQPKHSKLSKKDIQELLENYNISISQLPKIKKEDPNLPENCEVGDVIKIERREDDKTNIYFRVVV